MSVHSSAVIESALPAECEVSAGAYVGAGVQLGEGSTLGPGCCVEPGATLGACVELGAGAWVGLQATLADGVKVGARALIGGAEDASPPTQVERDARIGAGAVVLPGVRVGRGAKVAPGSLVSSDVPPLAIVSGHPAAITGYVDSPNYVPSAAQATGEERLGVGDARLVALPLITDLRGSLTFGEQGNPLPFSPQRYFVVFDVPGREIRGEHAHKELEQFLVCVHGSLSVVVDDGKRRAEVHLDSPAKGLYVPPLTWTVHYKYSPGAVLLVLASAPYDAEDYLRHYEEFLDLVNDPLPLDSPVV